MLNRSVDVAENQGVFMYTPVNLAKGLFRKTRITNESAGRVAIAGYTNPRQMVQFTS